MLGLDVAGRTTPFRRVSETTPKPPLTGPQITGRALKAVRLQLGLTQEEAADKAGVVPSSWRRYEWGERDLSLDKLARLAIAIGSTQQAVLQQRAILSGEAPPAPPPPADVIQLAERSAAFRGPVRPRVRMPDDTLYPWASSGLTIEYDEQLWPQREDGCVIELADGRKVVKIFQWADEEMLHLRELHPVAKEVKIERAKVRGPWRVTARISLDA